MPAKDGVYTLRLNKPPKATMKVKVVLAPRFKMRLWLAIRLIALAAWVLNWRVEIEDAR